MHYCKHTVGLVLTNHHSSQDIRLFHHPKKVPSCLLKSIHLPTSGNH